MAMFDGMNEIKKYGGKKITSMEDLLGSSQIREVDTIGSTIIVIREIFSFIVGEAIAQYGTNTMVI